MVLSLRRVEKLEKEKRVIVLHTTDTVYEALRAMASHRIGCVVVADEQGDCQGLITDRDIALSIALDDIDLRTTTLDELMTAPLICANSDAPLREIIEIMIANGVRRVPLVEQRGSRRFATGLVTVDDLIRSQAVPTKQIAAIIKAQNLGPQRFRMSSRKAERKIARREHTYRKFINAMMNAIELSREDTEQFIHMIMKKLVTRITPSEAFDFISQLPAVFHDELLSTKAGPTRAISRASLVADTRHLLGVSDQRAHQIISNFWHCLEDLMPGGELQDVLSQLPRDMQNLLLAA